MYRFALQPVLKQRKFKEESLQKQLALAERFLAEEKERLSNLKAARRKISKKLLGEQEKSIVNSLALLYLDYQERLNTHIREQGEKVSALEKEVQETRQQLIEAAKSRKALERLKEKGWEAYKQEMLRKEQKTMDEMGVERYSRGS